jgi:hypothetical protein
MKKLWKNYSYAIILVVLSFVGVFIFSNMFPSSHDDYMKVTVSKGETLWGISDKYSDQHHLSKAEFVEWVIPIKNSAIEMTEINELASK